MKESLKKNLLIVCFGLLMAASMAGILSWICRLPFWPTLIITLIAMKINGIIAEHEDNEPGGFNNPRMEDLMQAPFLIEEVDNGRDSFFLESSKAIINDEHDVLWDERYIGYDSRGVRFYIVGRTVQRKFFGFIISESTAFAFEPSEEQYPVERVKEMALKCVGIFMSIYQVSGKGTLESLRNKSLKEIYEFGINVGKEGIIEDKNQAAFEVFQMGTKFFGCFAILIFCADLIKYFILKTAVLYWDRSFIILAVGIVLLAWSSRSMRSQKRFIDKVREKGKTPDIKEFVVRSFVESTATPRHKASLEADLIKDLKCDPDDLSEFAMFLEEELNIRIPSEEWHKVHTLQQTIDLVTRYYSQGNNGRQDEV